LLLAVRARIAWLGGRTAEAADLARRAWDTDDLDPAARDQVAAMLGQIEALADRGDQAATWSRVALRDNRLDPGAAAHTRSQLALSLALTGKLDEARAVVADLPAQPEAVPPERHPELYVRGYLQLWSGPPAVALTDLRVAGRLTHGDMQPFRLAAAAAASTALFRVGDWDQCQATCDQTLVLARDMDQVWCLGFLHALAALVPAARGDWDAAEVHVASALDLARHAGEGAPRAYAGEAAAFLALCRGDLEAVVTATESLQGTPPAAATRDLGMFSWPLYRQDALIRLGRLEDADAELAAAVRRTRPRDLRAGAALDRLAGQLAAARHDPAAARECLSRAVDRADDRVDALERALALDALGRFLRRRGERRAATAALARAREHYVSLRAGPFLVRCDAELAACGVRDPEETLPLDPLTPQERVVATLICAGRTNKRRDARPGPSALRTPQGPSAARIPGVRPWQRPSTDA
jgi:tetratricopeptide (TPR) repeat protein